ncbi:T9SS type A sorting domain-containing protein [Hymenobacter arizonensis]|uniref:Por secretion system C-terminal sorting domain-containing protein n=1 Tax=Hymenobacter arizonensis TaxID=1227077 RepID=A0A1I5SRC6_HYMAR|nr:T9SS type A sorting domain-containing protein [Hymenobacter arizonensis]SFP73275.1 Por secretion system C-terminal sorting domain-containing protein [Hymenobacter arizonensis]
MLKTATHFLLLLAFVAGFSPARAQSGCPDPRATNYNPAAIINDGSCQYAVTSAALPLKTPLASAVPESSGLQYSSQSLWTFNDSGNQPILFKVDSTTGNVLQQVSISNFGNVDWEDIAADAQYLYIGDVGNNNGNRRDLRVLRVRKSAIGPGATETVAAEAIAFSYPDQTNFSPGTNNHNFDCEAFFYANDSLHLFTKNWADLRTKYYTIPAEPGTHVARLKATFAVNGLITAADLNPTGTAAALLGYNLSTGATFLWLLSNFRNTQYFQGNKRRIELPSALLIGQAEGLCFVDRHRVFVSNERLTGIVTVPQRLYELNTSSWLAPIVVTAAATAEAAGFQISPNPAHQFLRIERPTASTGELRLQLQDARGRTVAVASLPAGSRSRELPVAHLAAGLYLLRVESSAGAFSRKIEIQ